MVAVDDAVVRGEGDVADRLGQFGNDFGGLNLGGEGNTGNRGQQQRGQCSGNASNRHAPCSCEAKPASVILPMAWPLSSSAWASRRFSALIVPSERVRVVVIFP